MGARYLADTNTIIDLVVGRLPTASLSWLEQQLAQQTVAISIVTRIELLTKTEPAAEYATMQAFVQSVAVLPLAYYGRTMYEVNGPRVILTSFDVTSGKFRGKIGKLVLNPHTTLEDVRRFFPVAAREADQPSTGRPGEEMSLPFYNQNVPMDDSLLLLFKHGRLQAVEFFSPC